MATARSNEMQSSQSRRTQKKSGGVFSKVSQAFRRRGSKTESQENVSSHSNTQKKSKSNVNEANSSGSLKFQPRQRPTNTSTLTVVPETRKRIESLKRMSSNSGEPVRRSLDVSNASLLKRQGSSNQHDPKRYSLVPKLDQVEKERRQRNDQKRRARRAQMREEILEHQSVLEGDEKGSEDEPKLSPRVVAKGAMDDYAGVDFGNNHQTNVSSTSSIPEQKAINHGITKTQTESSAGIATKQKSSLVEKTKSTPSSSSQKQPVKSTQKKPHSDDSKLSDGDLQSSRSTISSASAKISVQRRKAVKKKKVPYRINGEKFLVYDYYRPTKIIGTGAYAVVIEAVDKRTEQKVAIKKNKGVFSALSDAKRILRELKLLLHFDHPNVIALLSVIPPDPFEQDDFDEVYLVMPKMETTLSRVIRSKSALSEKHKQYFIYQLLIGLRYIHQCGVIHRDLKPENILINGSDCRLKITDFGLARGVSKEEDAELTEYVVTRWYRAPEVMCSSRQYGAGVDIWSVGCIMAELWHRKPLYRGGNHIEQLKLIFQSRGVPRDTSWIKTPDARKWVTGMKPRKPQNFSQMWKGIDPNAVQLIEMMLVLDPNGRPTVDECIHSEWLKPFYNPRDEQRKGTLFDLSFEFESSIKTLFGVRHMMWEELHGFHKKQYAKLKRKKELQLQRKRARAAAAKAKLQKQGTN